ncbi:Hpt domain-containing protein [Paeniglutamicibacter antarcticus]|uniref:HPt domain-containing protein n=1 Tax=Paeniglutamicibacter antarcticus TaxID=494023 RepID=A0ABP9TJJ5_9MICC
MTLHPFSQDSAVCTRTLGKLCSELGTEPVMNFISQFHLLWPTRVARLHNALASHDRSIGEDSALSMKSAATMAGAHDLAHLAHLLHAAFRDGDQGAQCSLISRIEAAGTGILSVLEEPKFAEHALLSYMGFVSA